MSKRRPSKGDCFPTAGKFMMDSCLSSSGCGFLLVHGEVAGQGPLEGLTYGHGWVLDGEMVIDRSNGKDLRIPKVLYYAVGGVDHIGNVHTYTWEEAQKRILQYKHWGPWDLKTRSGL